MSSRKFRSRSLSFLSSILLFILLGGAGFINPAGAQDRTEIAAYIPHIPDVDPPVIDGVLDDPVWEYATQGRASQNSTGWFVRSNPNYPVDDPMQTGVLASQRNGDRPTDDTDASFRVWAMYDDQYLYIGVASLDFDFVNHLAADSVNGETWKEDALEVFVDGNHNRLAGSVNDAPDEYKTGGQFVITSAGAIRHQEAGNPTFGTGANDDWYAVALMNDNVDGTNYEFRIKLSKIGNPVPGSVIGFNIAMDDADDASASAVDYQLLWIGQAHHEDTYGNLEFGRRSITAPLVTDTVTIDGKMDEAAWKKAATGKGGVPFGPFDGATAPKNLADQSYDFYVMHNTEYLYVAIDVKDSEVIADSAEAGSEDGTTWYDDAVELFIDGNHSHTPGRTGQTGLHLGGQLVITPNQAYRDAEASEVEVVLYGPETDMDWYALTSLTTTGYIAEYRLKKSSMFDAPERETIGFEIAIDEDDSDPASEHNTGQQLNWNGHPHNEASYGDLVLGGPATTVLDWDIY